MSGLLVLVAIASCPEVAVQREHVHYTIEIAVDRSAGTLRVESEIVIPGPLTRAENVFVLGGSQTVQHASADGAIVEVSPTDVPWEGLQKIVVRPTDPGRPIVLRVRTEGRPATGGTPPINTVSRDLVELSLDGMWIPLQLGFQTRFTAEASIAGIPEGMTVAAQGTVERTGERVFIRRNVPDIDFAFVALPGLQRADAAGFEIHAADTTTETARRFRQHAPRALVFLEEWFGENPDDPVRLVIVRRERASGYARRGYIVVTEGSRRDEVAIAKFIAHELAHAWSPPVDPNTEDRWLQESTAEFIALRYVAGALGTQVADSILAVKRERAADASALLGHGARGSAELYEKGPILLARLEEQIGRQRMDEFLRRIADERPATTSEAILLLSDIAGEGMAAEFAEWLRS